MRQVSFSDLHADVTGEIELENKVLVVKRIKVLYHLAASEGDRKTIERVISFYADGCPIARSIRDSVEITSDFELTAA